MADDVHALAHEVVAQFDLEEVALGLLGAVLDGKEQLRIDAGEPGEDAGVVFVALAITGMDGAQLAGIGDDDLVTEFLDKAADPRAMRAHFEGDACAEILLGEPTQ